MSMPLKTSDETRADEQTAAVPANENAETFNAVNAANMDSALAAIDDKLAGLENIPLGKVTLDQVTGGAIAEVRAMVTGIRGQIPKAAVAAFKRADEKMEITEAPAVILTSGISVNDLVPGQLVQGVGFFQHVLEPTYRSGERLGKTVARFCASQNLSRTPRTFNKNHKGVGELGEGWDKGYGELIRGGWKFDPKRAGTQSYEKAHLNGLKIPMGEKGSSLGLYTMPLREDVDGKDRNGSPICVGSSMLALNNQETLKNGGKNPLHGTFIYAGSSDGAKYLQTCTEGHPDDVFTIHFPDGKVFYDLKGYDYGQSCVRPGVALEIGAFNHLIIPRGPV